MKKSYLLPITAALVLVAFTGCKDNGQTETEQPDPVFELSDNAIQATAEGGLYDVNYVLANPVEGGEIKLVSDVDWVSDPDYSVEGKVTVTVAPNYDNADRNANLHVTYTYGEGLVQEGDVVLHQVYAYDVNSILADFSGGYFYGRESNQANYAMYLSDLGTDENGTFVAGCTVYRLDIHSDTEPTDWTNITIPEGTYTFDALDEETSYYGKVNAAGDAWETTAYIEDCTINVTKDGETTIIDGTVTTQDGLVHHVYYEGVAKVDLYSAEGIGLIDHDIEIVDAHLSSNPSYVDGNDEVMVISLGIGGTPEGGDFMNPFTNLFVEMYAPADDRRILPGTYTIGNSQDAYTLYPGYIDPNTLYCMGTYAQYVHGASAVIALASEGTIDIKDGEDGRTYTVTVALKTAQGFSITGTYVGELYVDNIPGSSFSTLEDDYTVKMDEINYTFGSYYGDEFGTGGGHFTWEMTGPFEQTPDKYLTDGTGEAVYFDIVSSSMDFNAGPTSGTYKPAADPEAPKPGEYVPGYRTTTGMNVLQGTYYTGAYEDGYVSVAAPAVSGDLNITNHGDGTYTLSFAFGDGMGHTWDGEWTGSLGFMDWTWLYGSSANTSRPNYVERRMAPAQTEADETVNPAKFNIKTLPSL